MSPKKVLWFTGLSGSGKTTIAHELQSTLNARGVSSEIVDGDVIRQQHHRTLTFDPKDIEENNRLVAELCRSMLEKKEVIIVSLISPFRRSRDLARSMLSPFFSEIYIKADLDECIRRDVKGLYKRALNGEIKNFIGISTETPYEPPLHPDLVIDTQTLSVGESVDRILSFLELRSHS